MIRPAVGCVLLLTCACASGPHRSYMDVMRPQEHVRVVDTVPTFLAELQAGYDGSAASARRVLASYEDEQHSLLAAAGALDLDTTGEQMQRLAQQTKPVEAMLAAFEERAPGEVDGMVDKLARLMGDAPQMAVALAVVRAPQRSFVGEQHGRPLLLLNALHPQLASSAVRRTLLARELFRVLHAELQPSSESLTPFAERLYREGAVRLAARTLAPDAPEADALDVPPAQLETLRGREALLAQEGLTALDSARPEAAARFFDAGTRDALILPGSGAFLAARVYARIAADVGGTTRALRMAPREFLARARRALSALASPRR